jgi:predicted amidohydrolase
LSINIVPGTIVEKHGEELHNVAYFISNTGEILGRYQKKNLWHPERPHLTSSLHEPHQAFTTPLGKVGLLICWDLAFPEAFRELIASGAQIIIIPTFWNLSDCTDAGLKHNPQSEALFLESTLVSRCFENTCMVVFANAGGPKGKVTKGTYAGLSQVAVPFKGALGKMGPEEGMSVVEVDMEILEQAEDNYKVRADMGKEGWHYKYTIRPESSEEQSKL